MEEERYVIEISEYEGAMLLYEKINGVMTSIGHIPLAYAVDKEIASVIRSAVTQQAKPFMVAEGRSIYRLSTEFGEALKMHMKVFKMLPTLHEKLLYIDRTQVFSLISTQQYKELQDRLNLYYLVKKIEGTQEGSTET